MRLNKEEKHSELGSQTELGLDLSLLNLNFLIYKTSLSRGGAQGSPEPLHSTQQGVGFSKMFPHLLSSSFSFSTPRVHSDFGEGSTLCWLPEGTGA